MRIAPALALLLLTLPALAQPAGLTLPDAPRIAVPPSIQAEPASQASLQIQVGPTGALPSNSFIRLRGLPASVSLTEGHAIAPGSWAIPLFVLPSLKANVPAGISGRSEIVIQLVSVDGTMLAIQNFQRKVGMNPADGYAGVSLLARLRQAR